jgi:hypothetical protein
MDVIPMAALARAGLRPEERFSDHMVLAVIVPHSPNKAKLRPLHPNMLHRGNDPRNHNRPALSIVETTMTPDLFNLLAMSQNLVKA